MMAVPLAVAAQGLFEQREKCSRPLDQLPRMRRLVFPSFIPLAHVYRCLDTFDHVPHALALLSARSWQP